MIELNERLLQVEKAYRKIHQYVEEEKTIVASAQKLIQDIEHQSQVIDDVHPFVPVHYSTTNHTSQMSRHESCKGMSIHGGATPSEDIHVESSKAAKRPKQSNPISIKPIDKAEFDGLSGYMKGRLTLDKVNSAVDDICNVLNEKYKLLSVPPHKLDSESLKKYRDYKDQETNDTKSAHFFTDGDLKKTVHIKMDPAGRSILTILRSLNRIKEVRGGGLTRYVAL
eukprot:TRINITY_DN11521_c0_g1_i2.p1 TRINITY_DN11521_c0_g1~~TRINITY_DN11521_c0_g1_i2.p1  ORF type:complete len:225 (+),score=40.86 TRINITY_DN11521_c0_g1_i2:239-913(+)